MGLLSSRTFRQIALGAAGRYQEKRQTMRDRIDEYRERALTEKEKIQTKYNDYYDEEKQNVNSFKFVATKVGQSYLPQLNSFAASGGDLTSLQSMNIDDVRKTLDNYKPIEDSYVGGSSERLKLKSNELNQNLQDQVGLFKGTSTLFTKDLEEQGMKDIQSTVGTIDTGTPIDTRVSVGEGMTGTNNFVSQNKLIKNLQEFNTTYRKQKEDAAGRLLTKDDGSPDYDIFLPVETESILSNAEKIIQNGFPGSSDLAIGAVMENLNNPDYDLPFLTEAVEGSPIDVELTQMFNQFKEREATKQMQDTIDEFRERGLIGKADNLQQELDDIITKKTDESETVEETTTTTEQPTGDIPGTKTERKGKSVSITTEDYISPEQKDINSKKEVEEDFIKQVMEKNDVNRSRAIDILKLYGYTQFPKIEKKGLPFLKGNK
tara:strand:- start:210 stop:1508 length:1299 start_codon:yes stop_codon:yes gene_type:complete